MSESVFEKTEPMSPQPQPYHYPQPPLHLVDNSDLTQKFSEIIDAATDQIATLMIERGLLPAPGATPYWEFADNGVGYLTLQTVPTVNPHDDPLW
jgi:hypothetical protein